MKQFRAILVDSLYESVDRKSLLVLLILSALLILFVAGISFQTDKPEAVLEEQAKKIGLLSRGGGFFNWFAVNVDCKANDIKAVSKDEGWRPELNGGYAVTLTFKNEKEIDEFVRRARAYEARAAARMEGRPYKEPSADIPVTPQNRLRCLEVRFERSGYGHAQAKLLTQEPLAYRVAVRTDYPHELCGASHMKMLYGALVVPLPQFSVAEMVVLIQLQMANVFGGFIGVLVAILTCSGFVPSMLQKGTLDLVLARPIGRGRLLLYKYIGGLWFVFILASVVIGGCWLAITLRTGYANPWFLATILTITAAFAVIYSVSLLVGVLTRSGTVAALVAIFVWGTSETLIGIRTMLKRAYVGQMVPQWLQSFLGVLYDLAPKTGDLLSLNTHFLSRSHLSDAAFQRAFAGRIPKVDWLWSMGTTAAFTAAVLLLAVWFFKRRDY